MSEPAPPTTEICAHVLVDGFNVLHAVLLASERSAHDVQATPETPTLADVCWWRPEFQRRVVTWAEERVASGAFRSAAQAQLERPLRVTVVFDASREVNEGARVSSELVSVVYAPSADDWIVAACEHEPVTVVTADRALADRAFRWGARRIKPWQVDGEATPV